MLPCVATKITEIVTKAIAKGKSQYFFLALAYLKIWLKICRDFINY